MWKDLAEQISNRIRPFIQYKGGGDVDHDTLVKIMVEEMKKFDEERIVRIYWIKK